MNIPTSHYTPNSSVSTFNERRWIIWLKLLVDIVALQLAFVAGYYLRFVFSNRWPISISPDQYYDLACAMLLLPLGFWIMELYPGYGVSEVERFKRMTNATFGFFIILTVCKFFVAEVPWSRGVFLFALLFALIFPPILQSILRYLLIRFNMWGTPVIIIGAGLTGRSVISSLEKDPSFGLRPVAVFDDDQSLWGKTIGNVPIAGGIDEASVLSDVVRYAIIAMPGAGRDRIVKISHLLPFPKITVVPDLLGLQSLWVEVRDLGGIPGMEIQRQLLLKHNRIIKCCIDYCLGIPLFLISVPIVAVSALCIWFISPGSPFYTQERVGANGKKIKIFKLRTMRHDSEQLLEKYLAENDQAREEWNQFFKLKNDPRILPFVGTFLRKSSLDELPQLWNVLRGEMSLVGPRPFPVYHLKEFSEAFRQLRRSVLPGITGSWQVSARSNGDLAVQERLDTHYIRNWSVWEDLLVLGKTVKIVLSGKGAY
jgi:Undecaprenyl-phosphate galactose phosphotransferase WbaP